MPHPVSEDRSGAQRVAVGEVLPSFSATLSNSAVRQLVAVHRDSRVIHIFAFVEGVFALPFSGPVELKAAYLEQMSYGDEDCPGSDIDRKSFERSSRKL